MHKLILAVCFGLALPLVALAAQAAGSGGRLEQVLATREVRVCITPDGYAVKPGADAWWARLERFMADIKRDGRLLDSARRHRLEAIVVP